MNQRAVLQTIVVVVHSHYNLRSVRMLEVQFGEAQGKATDASELLSRLDNK